jgi:hypothetical protein
MTRLLLTNGTKTPVLTYITLGATDGCIHQVSGLTFSDKNVEIIVDAPLMGHLILKGDTSFYVDAPKGMGFNGNISFNTPPLNCKTTDFPFGVNLAEFIINNGFQEGNPQETIDNSCVSGANAKIKFNVTESDWAANHGKIPVKTFENKKWDDNTEITGVYPFGCDDCTSSFSPPKCVGLQPQNANSKHICNVQRNAKENEGGNVEIVFNGFL